MDISTLSSNSSSIYTVLDTTQPVDTGNGGATADANVTADGEAGNDPPALAGSSNALQSLFALAQPDTGSTTNQVTSGSNSAATSAPATASASTTSATETAANAPNAMALAGSTTTVNGDGSTTTTTINADGSVSVSTSSASSASTTSSAASGTASAVPGVDDNYLAYLSLPSIPMDNSTDYSDDG